MSNFLRGIFHKDFLVFEYCNICNRKSLLIEGASPCLPWPLVDRNSLPGAGLDISKYLVLRFCVGNTYVAEVCSLTLDWMYYSHQQWDGDLTGAFYEMSQFIICTWKSISPKMRNFPIFDFHQKCSMSHRGEGQLLHCSIPSLSWSVLQDFAGSCLCELVMLGP